MKSSARNNEEEVFLPVTLVKLVFKIAQVFQLTSFDEFSLLDTLQQGLNMKLKTFDLEDIDERKMCLTIVSIIRVSEKFNNINSEFTKVKLDTIFYELGITNEEFNNQEFTTFKEMNYHVETPTAAEALYELIEKHLDDFKKKDFLLEFSLDILRLAYTFKTRIYEV